MSQLQKDNPVQDKNKSIPGARQCNASLSDLSHWGASFRHVNFCRSERLSLGRRHKAACERDPSLHCCVASPEAVSVSASAQLSNTLQPPPAFAAISDPAERSRAIFAEAAKVLTNPRCMNCHPATDRVLQGNDKHPHQPVATR